MFKQVKTTMVLSLLTLMSYGPLTRAGEIKEVLLESAINFNMPAVVTRVLADKVQVIVGPALLNYPDNRSPGTPIRDKSELLQALGLPGANALVLNFIQGECQVNNLDAAIFFCGREVVTVQAAKLNSRGVLLELGTIVHETGFTNFETTKTQIISAGGPSRESYNAEMHLSTVVVIENRAKSIELYLKKSYLGF